MSNKPSRVCDPCFEKLSKGDVGSEGDSRSARSSASQQRADLLASQHQQPKKDERDYESEDDTPAPAQAAPSGRGADSDSEEEGDLARKVSELTIESSVQVTFSQNTRASLFFTNEENTSEAFAEES